MTVMPVDNLLAQVRAAGARIVLDGDHVKLRTRAPLPDGLLAELRQHKGEIKALLSRRADVLCEPDPASAPAGTLGTPEAERHPRGGGLEVDVASAIRRANLATGPAMDDPVEWRGFFEERAAIREYDAGYDRATAERVAFAETLETWCDRRPSPHDVTLCAGCGEPLGPDFLALPDGGRVHWETEREFQCLVAYGFARKRRAIAALAAMGLTPPAGDIA